MRLFTDDRLATLTIWAEGEGEPYFGKVCIGEIIRRRARLKYDSDGTIAGTVAMRIQFSFFNDDKQDNTRLIAALQIDDLDPIVNDCRRAWYESEHTNYSNNAVLYCRTDIDPRPPWYIESKRVAIIGNHSFFTD